MNKIIIVTYILLQNILNKKKTIFKKMFRNNFNLMRKISTIESEKT